MGLIIPLSIFRDMRVEKLIARYSIEYKGRLVGYVVEKKDLRAFVTVRDFERHFFRIFNGYGISLPILSLLRLNGIRCIIIVERHEGFERKLVSDVNDWMERGHEYTFVFPDGTLDPQRVLPVAEMEELN